MNVSSFVVSPLILVAVAVSLATLAPSARADGPPPLPPEAYAACESKAEGDACSVQLRDREAHGQCAPDRDGKRLFCRLDDPPPPPPPDHT